MNTADILSHLQSLLPDAGLEMDTAKPESLIVVPPESLHDVARCLRDDPKLAFDCLMCLSGLETNDQYQVVLHLYSMKHNHKAALRCGAPKDNPVIPTVSDLWATADWHEREAADMFGIRFEGHPDPRRMLCPDDWEGYPLRKDYKPQEKWHDIPLTVNIPMQERAEKGTL